MIKTILQKQLTQTQAYVAGFVFSIILTLIPYYIVSDGMLEGDGLLFALLGYASLQLVVQLLFFLHLGQEDKPRWRLISIVFMMSTMLFIGVGTLWIMKNLNYNMMMEDPKTTESRLIEDQNLQPDKSKVQEPHDHSNHSH